MSSLERFRERNKQRIVAQKNLNTKFIFDGNSAIDILGLNDVTVKAAVVNQQEKDKAYVFTELVNSLTIGSVWQAKNLHLLITEEITEIKDVNWRKYVALLCNLKVEDTWGYFKGPEKTYISTNLEEDSAIDSRQKPVLVLPDKILGFEDKIVIKGRAWLVQEYDAISNPGLVYYSLISSTVSKEVIEANKDKDVFIEHKHESDITFIETPVSTFDDQNILISNNIDITVSTERGYFKTSNTNIKIKKHSADMIVFNLPFGVKETTIQILEKGQVISKTFKVR